MKYDFEGFPKFPKFVALSEEKAKIQAIQYCYDVKKYVNEMKAELRDRYRKASRAEYGILIKEILGE